MRLTNIGRSITEQAIAVESFVNGVLGSAAKVIIDKPTAAYMPGMAMGH